uniref:Uncharacterized protein n=1 Tax=Setaria italica TaxID=4555 RepID=K3ZFP0_SETIT
MRFENDGNLQTYPITRLHFKINQSSQTAVKHLFS